MEIPLRKGSGGLSKARSDLRANEKIPYFDMFAIFNQNLANSARIITDTNEQTYQTEIDELKLETDFACSIIRYLFCKYIF